MGERRFSRSQQPKAGEKRKKQRIKNDNTPEPPRPIRRSPESVAHERRSNFRTEGSFGVADDAGNDILFIYYSPLPEKEKQKCCAPLKKLSASLLPDFFRNRPLFSFPAARKKKLETGLDSIFG